MNIPKPGIKLKRKLSVIYLFLIALTLFFGFYYFKFVPQNQEETNHRCFRLLKNLTDNITDRHRAIVSVFSNVKDTSEFVAKKGLFRQFDNIYPYEYESNSAPDSFTVSLTKDNKWTFDYPIKNIANSPKKFFTASISAENIIGNVLFERNELFDTYFFLKDSIQNIPVAQNKEEQHVYSIVYQQDKITSSSNINLDTLNSLRHNSDMSYTLDMELAGQKYKLFIVPMKLGNSHFLLTGMITKASYDKMVNYAPFGTSFFIVVFILLMLITMPYLKVFLLSAKERIGLNDLVGTILSIFFGSSIIVIMLMSIVLYYSFTQKNNKLLEETAQKIKADLVREIDSAKTQIDAYVRELNDPKNEQQLKSILFETPGSPTATDLLLKPGAFKTTSRVLWLDTGGTTLAKWSPLTFSTPFTKVNDFDFFDYLEDLSKKKELKEAVVYPTISNATGEFLMIIGRPQKTSFVKKVGTKDTVLEGSYICLATYLHCTTYPILTNGLGFALIDNDREPGKVLVHSNSLRNLQEDFYHEIDRDPQLLENIQHHKTNRFSHQLYGKSSDLFVTPIKNQPFSLVVWFDKTSQQNTLSRIIYFAFEVIFCILLGLSICILVASIRSTIGKVKIPPARTEWFRPSAHNADSYRMNKLYFVTLFTGALVFSLVIFLLNLDLRNIFYMALLLPFITITGFIVSRKKTASMIIGGPGNGMNMLNFFRKIPRLLPRIKFWSKYVPAKKLQKMFEDWCNYGAVSLLFILIPNAVIFFETGNHESNYPWLILLPFLLFQVFAFVMLAYYYLKIYYAFQKIENKFFSLARTIRHQVVLLFSKRFYPDPENAKKDPDIKRNVRDYIISVYMGMLLVGVLPAVGIFLYGYSAEKMQGEKENLWNMAKSLQAKADYFSNELEPNYKASVFDSTFRVSLESDYIKHAGRYLPTKYSIGDSNLQNQFYVDTAELIDGPYNALMSDFSVLNTGASRKYFIDDQGSDSAWYFAENKKKDTMSLFHFPYANNKPHLFKASSTDYKNLSDLIPAGLLGLPICIILIIVSIFCSFSLIKSTLERLFLLNYFIESVDVKYDTEYFQSFFKTYPIGECYLSDVVIPKEEPWTILENEDETAIVRQYARDEYILALCHSFDKVFEQIWLSLNSEEQYFIFDISLDGYTNYKDAATIYALLHKKILIYKDMRLVLFSKSFQEFILSKKDTDEIKDLEERISVPGVWGAMRTPIFIMITLTAVFLAVTQNDLSHKITAIVTSVGAIIPLILKLTEKMGSKAPAELK